MKISKAILGLLIILTVTAALGASAYASGEASGGGDAFDQSSDGGGYAFFDVLEYGQPIPSSLPEFRELETRLDRLNSKLPSAVGFIRRVIADQSWFFVKPKLKSVNASGQSNLVLTYNKVQAAITSPSTLITQINKRVWDSLDEQSRIYLLLHEAMWAVILSDRAIDEFTKAYCLAHPDEICDPSAAGHFGRFTDVRNLRVNLDDIVVTSEEIRTLTGILLSSRTTDESTSPEAIATLLKNSSGVFNSRSTYTVCREDTNGACIWIQVPLDSYPSVLALYAEYDANGGSTSNLPVTNLTEGATIILEKDLYFPSGSTQSEIIAPLKSHHFLRTGISDYCYFAVRNSSAATRVIKKGTVLNVKSSKLKSDLDGLTDPELRRELEGLNSFFISFEIADSSVDHVNCGWDGSPLSIRGFNESYGNSFKVTSVGAALEIIK